jgi:pre-mRNA-splicing factor CDC5/CEF1
MQESVIMLEAKNLRILREMTPLLDGQRDSELPELYEGTGFAGVQPKNARLATPNVVFGTPMHGGHIGDAAASDIGSVMGTPARFALPSSAGSVASGNTFRSSGATPLVMRDQFGLNAGTSDHMSETMSVSGQSFHDSNSVFSLKAREKQLKSILAAQLKSLPEPEFTYDIALPEVQGDDEAPKGPTKPEDAADIMAREEKKKRDAEQAELARRSTVLKRALPRPNITPSNRDAVLQASEDVVNAMASLPDNKAFVKEELKKASAAINAEALTLVAHEAFKYPDAEALARRPNGKRPTPVDLPLLDDALMQKARDAVAAELRACTYEPYSASQFEAAWTEVYNSLTFVPPTATKGGHFAPSAPLTKNDVIASAKYQCDAILNKVKQVLTNMNACFSSILLLELNLVLAPNSHAALCKIGKDRIQAPGDSAGVYDQGKEASGSSAGGIPAVPDCRRRAE